MEMLCRNFKNGFGAQERRTSSGIVLGVISMQVMADVSLFDGP